MIDQDDDILQQSTSTKRRVSTSEFIILSIVCCCMFALNIYASVFFNDQHTQIDKIYHDLSKISKEIDQEVVLMNNNNDDIVNNNNTHLMVGWSNRLQSITTIDLKKRSDKLFSASQSIAITICVILLIPSIYSYARAEPGQFRMRFRNFSYYKMFWLGILFLFAGLGLGGGGLLQFGRYNPQFGLSLCIAGECLWIIGGYFISDLSPKTIPREELSYQEQRMKKQAEQLAELRAAMAKEALQRQVAVAQVHPVEQPTHLVELKENELLNVEVRRNPPPAFAQ